MTTSASDPRWHQIPSPTARITNLETRTRDSLDKIYEELAKISYDLQRLKEKHEYLRRQVEENGTDVEAIREIPRR